MFGPLPLFKLTILATLPDTFLYLPRLLEKWMTVETVVEKWMAVETGWIEAEGCCGEICAGAGGGWDEMLELARGE